MKIEVKTKFNINQIEIETDLVHGGYRENISRQAVQLQEEAVRNALIKLGWTPPKEEGTK